MSALPWAIWLLWSLSLPPELTVPDEASLRRALWRAGRAAEPAAASAGERAALRAAIPLLFDAAQGDPTALPRAVAHVQAHRLEIVRWTYRGAAYLVLKETPGAARGFGAFVFRVAPVGRRVILQAPHAYFERHIGAIAISLFFDPGPGAAPHALFVNTVHRFGRGPRRAEHPADPCDSIDHPLSVATAAGARPNTRIIQLHGFARRASHPARVILSGGRRPAPPYVTQLARRLGAVLPDVAVYPDNVNFLGARTNAQAQVVRGLADVEFIHVELDAQLRARLRTEPFARRAFARALLELP